MKRELYITYLISKYLMVTIAQVNMMSDKQKAYYVEQIEEYIKHEKNNN